jgi:hypothetical protein
LICWFTCCSWVSTARVELIADVWFRSLSNADCSVRREASVAFMSVYCTETSLEFEVSLTKVPNLITWLRTLWY